MLQAILVTETDASLNILFDLLDSDAFKENSFMVEYPVLTVLAMAKTPSAALLNRIKTYLNNKDTLFPYLNKMYLIYSTLIHKYCSNNECSENNLVIKKFKYFLSIKLV